MSALEHLADQGFVGDLLAEPGRHAGDLGVEQRLGIAPMVVEDFHVLAGAWNTFCTFSSRRMSISGVRSMSSDIGSMQASCSATPLDQAELRQ